MVDTERDPPPGHLDRIDVKIKELKSLPIRAADALERSPSDMDIHLVEELRKAVNDGQR